MIFEKENRMNTAVKKEKCPIYKIDRDQEIFTLEVEGLTAKEIAVKTGLTESCIRHTLAWIKTIDSRGDICEYFDLGVELCSWLDEAGCDADIDRCMTMIMRELWSHGYNTRPKIAKLTKAQIDELLMSHRITRVGAKGTGAFLDWLKALKDEIGKKSKKNRK